METSLLVFAAAVVGSAIGPLVVALLNLRTNYKDRMESRRKERLNYLDGKLQALIDLRGDLQWYQQEFPGRQHSVIAEKAEERREISYGKAYGIMVSVNDDKVRLLAPIVMKPNISAADKLQAIDGAIEHLGNLTMELLPSK
jgi:hypothetical protein